MKNTSIKVGIAAIALSFSQLAIADNVYTIYPIPQQQVAVQDTAQVTSKVNVILEKGIDTATKARIADVLTQHQLEFAFSDKAVEGETNIYLGINGSGEMADQMFSTLNLERGVFTLENKYDRHCVSLSSKNGLANIVIIGENTDATFFGIASLEQILDNDKETLPCVTIYDYADQKSRGIVEGYYGYPYSVEVKKDLMRFMMRYKMNTYMYGAKSDPYHSQYWKNPYPTSLTSEQIERGWLSQDMIKEVTQTSHATKVNFIWAIHPGNDIINSNTVVNDVTSKFDKMYQLGVRQFAVFVDDVGVPEADNALSANARNISNIQKAIEKKYNTSNAAPKDTVKPLHFVPQVYCTSFASNEAKRKKFFAALSSIPDNITVYTTGWGVWSVPNHGDFQRIEDELGRSGAWWWNYPCNDNADSQLYPMDMYSNFYDMPAVDDNARLPKELTNGLGIVCNPMQQGEVSKIPLFSAADYAWNTSEFNNLESWNASFPAIVGKEKAASLQLLAKYLRWNDPSELNALINNFKSAIKQGNPNIVKLKTMMDEVANACTDIVSLKKSSIESDRLLYKDLSPWLLKLQQMVTSINNLLIVSNIDNEAPEKWDNYIKEVPAINSLDTEDKYKAYALEGMGNGISVSVRPSQPSQKYLYPFVNFLKENVLSKYFPKAITKPTLISNVENVKGSVTNLRGNVYLGTSCTNTIKKGEFIGISLVSATKLADITLADSLVQNYTILYSTNGKFWKKYTEKTDLLNEFVKYICVQNISDTPKVVRMGRNVLNVELPKPTEISSVTIPQGNFWDNHTNKYLTDGDYSTFVCLNRNQQHGDIYSIKMKRPTPIYDVRVCMGTVNGDHMNVGNVEISRDGNKWKKIYIKGTYLYDFKMNLPQVVKYSDEMSYCDFDAKGEEALYVRFNVKNARTNKWLRFYELEVNKKGDQLQYVADCVDNEGIAVKEISDKLGHTSMTDVKQSITYHFNDINYLKAVEIYQNAAASADSPASILITSNGRDWNDYGKLTENKHILDLTLQEDAIAMKIEWTEKAPAIYEIIAVTNTAKQAEVTKIEKITSSEQPVNFKFDGRTIAVEATSGISQMEVYTIDGKTILNYIANGSKAIHVPLLQTSEKNLLIKVSLNNGERIAYKVTKK